MIDAEVGYADVVGVSDKVFREYDTAAVEAQFTAKRYFGRSEATVGDKLKLGCKFDGDTYSAAVGIVIAVTDGIFTAVIALDKVIPVAAAVDGYGRRRFVYDFGFGAGYKSKYKTEN